MMYMLLIEPFDSGAEYKCLGIYPTQESAEAAYDIFVEDKEIEKHVKCWHFVKLNESPEKLKAMLEKARKEQPKDTIQ